MASDKEVLDKADALLRRHAISSPGAGSDTGGVPILTDLVDAGHAPQGDLAREVFKRVMQEVEGRLAHDLEARLAQHLVPHVHATVAAALADLRQELANAIGDAVNEALAKRPVK